MRSLGKRVGVSIGIGLAAAGPGLPSAAAPAGDRQAVEAAMQSYAAALRAAPAATVAGFYAADGSLLLPGMAPLRGPSAIQAFLAPLTAGIEVQAVEVSTEMLQVHGATADQWGTYRQTAGERGQPMQHLRGRYAALWRHEREGRWRLVRMMMQPLPAEAAADKNGQDTGHGGQQTKMPQTKTPQTPTTQTITPGAVWHDTAGQVIQAHGAGMLQVGKTFYWFGEDKTDGYLFQNVNCYASTDLAHWTLQGRALTRQADGDLGPNRVVERPKVLYNPRTRTYVMYLHIDSTDYKEAKVGVASSRTPAGPYTYLGSFRPSGHQSRDMTVFADTDGTQYLVYEDRERGVALARLTASGYGVEEEVALIPHAYEAPAVIKAAGTYYLLGSHLSGWNTNPNQYATAPALAGPWSEFKDVAPPQTNTYNSQTAFILPVVGTQATTYVYLGDRWNPKNLTDSRYIWLPLAVGGGKMTLAPDQPWAIDAATGLVSVP